MIAAASALAGVLGLLSLARPARAELVEVSTPPLFSMADYVRRAVDVSPELAQAEAGLREADLQWKSETAAAWLPAISFTGTGYPYGHNSADSYRFEHWRLNRNDVSFNSTVGLNLFNSFQDANRVGLARNARNAALYAREASRQDRLVQAARVYLDLCLRDRLLEVARENLKAQQEQYRLTEDLYKHGMKSLTDLLKSETDWRSSELRMTYAHAQRRRALAIFNSLIDSGPEETARLEPLADPEPGALRPLADDLAAAAARRPEVLRAHALEARAAVARRQARRDLLPVFSVDAAWNWQDTGDFGRPVATPSGIPSPNYQLGLRLSLPSGYNIVSQAGRWGAAAAAERRAMQERIAQERQVRLEAVQARISLEQALGAVRIAAQKADLSARNLGLVTEQYRQGAADVIRLGQAQLDYLQARTERGQAAHDAGVSLLEYKRAIGEQR